MLSPRWRKILRDLWGNKTRTTLVVLSIAVGVFAVGTISSARVIIARDLGIGYSATRPISAAISTQPFDDELVATIRALPGVSDADARRSYAVQINVGEGPQGAQWRDLELIALRDFDKQHLDIVQPETGEWPPPERTMLVERAALGLTNARVGDTVLIERPDGKTRELRISGTAHHLLRAPAAFSGTVAGYISLDTLEWLGQPREYNVLTFAVAENALDRPHIQAVAEQVRTRIEKSGRQVFGTFLPTPGRHPADDAVQPILLVLTALGYLALALSGFLIVNTIGAILTQQTRQIGVMKAIGARTSQIIELYVGMVLIFGVLSLCVAVPLGALAARFFVDYVAGIINFDVRSYSPPPDVLLLEIAIGLLVPLLAAIWPIIAGARVTVREAISAYGLGSAPRTRRQEQRSAGITAALGAVLRRLRLSRPLLLSLRNTFRRKARLLLTLTTLTLGGAIFIAVFSVRESLLLTLDDALKYQTADAEIRFARPQRAAYLQQQALRVPGVQIAESWATTSARRLRPDLTESGTISVFAPPANTRLLDPTVLAGRWLLPDDENAVVINTDLVREESDIQVGDMITLKLSERETRWRVVGLVRGVLSGPYAYVNYPYFAQIERSVGRARRLYVVGTRHDAASQQQLARALSDHFTGLGLDVSATRTAGEQASGVKVQFNILVVFLLMMAVLIAAVGGLGLMGTMSINVLERTREIGVLRAIGASNGAVLHIFMVEGMLIGMLSWIAAAALALPISRLLSDAVGNAFLRAPLSFRFSLRGVLLWLVFALALAALATFMPARRAARLSVREVLAYE